MPETLPYIIAWSLYLLAAVGVCIACWRATRRLHQAARRVLRSLLAAVLFTPWFVFEGSDALAPAYFVALFEAVFDSPQAGLRGLLPMVAAFVWLLVLWALEALVQKLWLAAAVRFK